MNRATLQQMYQAWMQDNPDYIYQWLDFVEFAAKNFRTQQDEVMRELQKCSWFQWGDK